MDKNEFERFETEAVRLRTVTIDELQSRAPRTLLLGVDWRDETVHVYIDQAGCEIHVLRYVTVGAGANEQMLVLSHTQGANGGVTSHADFVPQKGHCPEFCDYEFCALLRSYGVSLRFTKFDPARHTMAKQHEGYAGPIWAPDLPRATSLQAATEVGPSSFMDAKVLRELLKEACVVADVSYVIVNGDVMVADSDVDQALGPANALLSSLGRAALQNPSDVLTAICAITVSAPEGNCADGCELEEGGNCVFPISFDNAWVRKELPGVTYYDASDYRTALLGTYEGRPYLLVYEYADWEGIFGHVHVSLFGSTDKFIADMTRRYKLELAVKD